MASYAQFGYPYATAASQLLMPGSQPTATVAGGGGGSGSGCCETGRLVADPVTGQPVCSCQYESSRLAALNSYPRLSTGSSLYGAAAAGYPASDQGPYPSIGVDSSYFGSLSSPYGLKDTPGTDMGVYGGLGSTAGYGYSPYDPSLYGYGAPYDLAARRKNATRESTGTLKAWLNEHKKNPYPTKGEKIMLAIITKMTLTQVSTWFANARRRLKKENKMTWEPRNRTDDDDGDSDAEVAKSDDDTKPEREGSPADPAEDRASPSAEEEAQSPVKPRIWSLADMAMSGSSPASRLPPLGPAFLPTLPGGGKLLLPFPRPHHALPYGRPESSGRAPPPPPPPPAAVRSPSPDGSAAGDSDRA